MGRGYVIEYITKTIEKPNDGFADHPDYLRDKALHAENAGRLIAVHRLRPSMRPLRTILGDEAFERLQDMWATGGDRRRWSVAFPIIESYDIAEKPVASDVLGAAAYARLFRHSSATLRPLTDQEFGMIAGLAITSRPASNSWIAIEDEILIAEKSEIPADVMRCIDRDLGSALEGMTEERKTKIRRRAAWLAHWFVRDRQKARTLRCDHCSFDPIERLKGLSVKPRSALDVHHLRPLDEGKRRTTVKDFALLCPTCHRIEHLTMKQSAERVGSAARRNPVISANASDADKIAVTAVH
jgi:5-methylcytosine-specific restriction protein A